MQSHPLHSFYKKRHEKGFDFKGRKFCVIMLAEELLAVAVGGEEQAQACLRAFLSGRCVKPTAGRHILSAGREICGSE